MSISLEDIHQLWVNACASDALSNANFFPVLQFTIGVVFVYVLATDRWRVVGVVTRADDTMKRLEKGVGAVVAAIVVIINASVFNDDQFYRRRYSAFINFADLLAIVYVFYFSRRGRSCVIGIMNRMNVER